VSVTFSKITPHQGRLNFGSRNHGEAEEKGNRFGFQSAVIMSAGGAAGGLLHARYLNKSTGMIGKLAKNPTIEAVQEALKTKGKGELNPNQRRTATVVLGYLKRIEEHLKDKTGEELKKAEKRMAKNKAEVVNLLKKGSKPYGKATAAGVITGIAVYAFHKIFVKCDDTLD